MGGSAETDVLVIGAGPAGLFAALELARRGVRARVVERAPKPHRQARAAALQPATLEILQQAGCLDPVLGASVHVRFARVFDAGLTCLSEQAFAGAGCCWEFQCSLPQPACLTGPRHTVLLFGDVPESEVTPLRSSAPRGSWRAAPRARRPA